MLNWVIFIVIILYVREVVLCLAINRINQIKLMLKYKNAFNTLSRHTLDTVTVIHGHLRSLMLSLTFIIYFVIALHDHKIVI